MSFKAKIPFVSCTHEEVVSAKHITISIENDVVRIERAAFMKDDADEEFDTIHYKNIYVCHKTKVDSISTFYHNVNKVWILDINVGATTINVGFKEEKDMLEMLQKITEQIW